VTLAWSHCSPWPLELDEKVPTVGQEADAVGPMCPPLKLPQYAAMLLGYSYTLTLDKALNRHTFRPC
jgi:hypothetical protein